MLTHLHKTLRVTPSLIAQDSLEANPKPRRGDISVTCSHGMIQEVRICLTKGLGPRPCSANAAGACPLPSATIDALR